MAKKKRSVTRRDPEWFNRDDHLLILAMMREIVPMILPVLATWARPPKRVRQKYVDIFKYTEFVETSVGEWEVRPTAIAVYGRWGGSHMNREDLTNIRYDAMESMVYAASDAADWANRRHFKGRGNNPSPCSLMWWSPALEVEHNTGRHTKHWNAALGLNDAHEDQGGRRRPPPRPMTGEEAVEVFSGEACDISLLMHADPEVRAWAYFHVIESVA